MSELLCTFSGKSGDILWSLPTAKSISELFGKSVDFAIMPYYQNMIPLLASQPYIDKAYVMPDWLRTHSNHGDQPFQPPEHYEKNYTKAFHLTYKAHPGISAPEMPLIQFIAYQAGISLHSPVVPFIFADESVHPEVAVLMFGSGSFTDVVKENRLVCYAFNEQYGQQKEEFFNSLLAQMQGTGVEFYNLNAIGWKESAYMLSKSLLFVGCRSANWVIAQGLGKEAITFEPHPARHARGHLGKVFGCPFGIESPLPFGMPAVESGKVAAALIKSRMEKNESHSNKTSA